MSSIGRIFSSPKRPKLPPPPKVEEVEPVEEIETVTADAEVAQRRKKRGIRRGGRQSTVLFGIESALKKRLGE